MLDRIYLLHRLKPSHVDSTTSLVCIFFIYLFFFWGGRGEDKAYTIIYIIRGDVYSFGHIWTRSEIHRRSRLNHSLSLRLKFKRNRIVITLYPVKIHNNPTDSNLTWCESTVSARAPPARHRDAVTTDPRAPRVCTVTNLAAVESLIM